MITNDPGHYEEISEPFSGQDAANEALKAFFDAVQRAREEHCIADVVVVVQVSTRDPDGASRKAVASAYFGDPLANKLPLLAREYGAAREQHEQILGALIESGRRSVRDRG